MPPMSWKNERSLAGGGVSANSGVKYCAPPISSVMPLTRLSVPSVTTNDGMRTIVVKNALTRPTAAPPASASRMARYRFIPSFIQRTPSRIGANANVAPIERSISAAMMTSVWPSATMASELAERTRSIRFALSKKFELTAPKASATAKIASHRPPMRARMRAAFGARRATGAASAPPGPPAPAEAGTAPGRCRPQPGTGRCGHPRASRSSAGRLLERRSDSAMLSAVTTAASLSLAASRPWRGTRHRRARPSRPAPGTAGRWSRSGRRSRWSRASPR